MKANRYKNYINERCWLNKKHFDFCLVWMEESISKRGNIQQYNNCLQRQEKSDTWRGCDKTRITGRNKNNEKRFFVVKRTTIKTF